MATTKITIATVTATVTEFCELEWWKTEGVEDEDVIAAYQAKGAGSYAASKVNLANPGTYNLSDGAAFPTWDAVNGWTFVSASSQYLTCTAIVTAVPITIIGRFSAANVLGNYVIASLCDADNDSCFVLYAMGGETGDHIWAYVLIDGADARGESSTGFTASTPYTAAGVYAANNNRTAYIDGGNSGNNTNVRNPTNIDTTYIGVYFNGVALTNYMNGSISACAFYNIALTDVQVAAITDNMEAL